MIIKIGEKNFSVVKFIADHEDHNNIRVRLYFSQYDVMNEVLSCIKKQEQFINMLKGFSIKSTFEPAKKHRDKLIVEEKVCNCIELNFYNHSEQTMFVRDLTKNYDAKDKI